MYIITERAGKLVNIVILTSYRSNGKQYQTVELTSWDLIIITSVEQHICICDKNICTQLY